MSSLGSLTPKHKRIIYSINELKAQLESAVGSPKYEILIKEINLLSKKLSKIQQKIAVLDVDGTIMSLIMNYELKNFISESEPNAALIYQICRDKNTVFGVCNENDEKNAKKLFASLDKGVISMVFSIAQTAMLKGIFQTGNSVQKKELKGLVATLFEFAKCDINFEKLTKNGRKLSSFNDKLNQAMDAVNTYFRTFYGDNKYFEFLINALIADNKFYPIQTVFSGYMEENIFSLDDMQNCQNFSICEFLLSIVSDHELLKSYMLKKKEMNTLREKKGLITVIFTLGLCGKLFEKIFNITAVDSLDLNVIKNHSRNGKFIETIRPGKMLDKKTPEGYSHFLTIVSEREKVENNHLVVSILDDTKDNVLVADRIPIDMSNTNRVIMWVANVNCKKITDNKDLHDNQKGAKIWSSFLSNSCAP